MSRQVTDNVAVRLLGGAAAAAVATVLTAAFQPFVAQNIFMAFLMAILASGLWGGMSAGLAATLGSTLGLGFAIFEPFRALQVDAMGDRVRLVLIALTGVLISALAEALRGARRRAAERERSLRESEESYRSLFTQTAEALYLLDEHGRFVQTNAEAARMYGFEPHEMVGMTPVELTPARQADPSEALRRVAAALGGEPQRFEWWGQRRSGVVFPMEVALGRARYMGRDVVIAAARDLTDQRRLEEQLQQAQKMEAVGRLASGVAHDFNNILTTIRGRASLLAERIPSHDALREDVDEIERAAELATTVTRQLLEFGRQRDPSPARLTSLRSVVGGVEAMLRRILGERITLVTTLSAERDEVRADAGQLEQVVLNLVINARDALPEGGNISISTDREGPHIRLVVQDTGLGMDEETLKRAFEPFFTTKPLGKGTGLGLSTVHAIVQRHGGAISVRSRPGCGTTFEVVFPAAAAADALAAPAAPAVAAEADGGGRAGDRGPTGETILLVEDEEPVRSLVRKVLRRHGYRVVEAGNAEVARAAWRADPGRFQLVLSDVGLPDADGRDLTAELRRDRPGVPVVLASGYGLEEGAATAGRARTTFLPKPFTPAELMGAVRQALEAGAARAA